MELILASQSPRRKELLTLMGLTFQTIASDVVETAPPHLTPGALTEHLARQKAEAVARMHPHACVIGSDTVVYIDDTPLNKPKSEQEAFEMLSRLQGREHEVYTGVCVICSGQTDTAHERTRVVFAPMTEAEIRWYIQTGEPMDKAGAYGIQGHGGMFVKGIEGNYFNVMGLPLPLTYRMLKQTGYFFQDL